MSWEGNNSAAFYHDTALPFTGQIGTLFASARANYQGALHTLVGAYVPGQAERVGLGTAAATKELRGSWWTTGGVNSPEVLISAGTQANGWRNYVLALDGASSRSLQPGVQFGRARGALGNTGRSVNTATYTQTGNYTGLTIGCDRYGATPTIDRLHNTKNYMGNVAVWDVALTEAQQRLLLSGVHPLNMTPRPRRFFPMRKDAVCELTGIVMNRSGTTHIFHTEDIPPTRPKLRLLSSSQMRRQTAPTIASTNNTDMLLDETSLIITGTNTVDATTVTIADAAANTATLSISAQNAATVTCTAKDLQTTALMYGAGTVTLTGPGGVSNALPISIAPKAGQNYVNVASYVAGENYGKGIVGLVDGWQVVYVTSQSGSTIAVGSTTDMVIAPSLPNGTVLYRAFYDTTSHAWTEDTVTVNQVFMGVGAGQLRRRRRR